MRIIKQLFLVTLMVNQQWAPLRFEKVLILKTVHVTFYMMEHSSIFVGDSAPSFKTHNIC